MKNKILSFAVCITLAIVSMFSLVGCNESANTISVASATELSEAIESAKNNDTIKLEKDIVIDKQLTITKKLKLDLNSHKISNETDIWNNSEGIKTWSLLSVQENGDLTIEGNGILEAKENDCYAVDVRDNASCTINDSTFNGNISAVYVLKGNLFINGGTFKIQQLSAANDNRYTINCLDENLKNGTANIIVKGGRFNKFDPSASNSEYPQKNFVDEGFKSTLDGNDYVVSKNA